MQGNRFLGLSELLVIHGDGDLSINRLHRGVPGLLRLRPVVLPNGQEETSDISGAPSLIILTVETSLRLTPAELDRFLRRDLRSEEFFALRYRGQPLLPELADAFYDLASGRAKRPRRAQDTAEAARPNSSRPSGHGSR